MTPEFMERSLSNPSLLERGVIVEVFETGEILVDIASEPPCRTLCDFLTTADGPMLSLAAGDLVLVLRPRTLEERGCILGRIGRYTKPDPREIVIESKKSLKLKCGQSSIEMRQDGKLLVKGVDVVSRAKRTNKVKGGSVQIN